MAQAVSLQPLTAEPRLVNLEFVVDKVALGQDLTKFFGFPVTIIPPRFSMLMYHLRDEQFRDTVSPHQQEQQVYELHF
jgi:hypothetical protein